jgi:hypothetical protein
MLSEMLMRPTEYFVALNANNGLKSRQHVQGFFKLTPPLTSSDKTYR